MRAKLSLLTVALPPTLPTPRLAPHCQVSSSSIPYTNTELNISIILPSDLHRHKEGWNNTSTHPSWSIHWGNIEYNVLETLVDQHTAEITPYNLNNLCYYSITIDIDPSPQPLLPGQDMLTANSLHLLIGADQHVTSTAFHDIPSVQGRAKFLTGPHLTDVGENVDYYILDRKRLIHIQGSTYNSERIKIATIEQIISTLQILDPYD
jgi:hypothetical protein